MPAKVEVHKVQEYSGHNGSVFALAPDEKRHRFYTSGDDGIVAAWELMPGVDRGEALLRLSNSVYALLAPAGQSWLAAGASDGTIFILDHKRKEILHQYARSRDSIYNFFFHSPSESLWVLHGGGYLSILETEHFREKAFRRLAQNHLRSIAHDPISGRIFIGTSDNHILVLDGEDFQVIHHWQAHDNSVFSLMVHPEGRYLFSGSRDAHFKIWDLSQSGFPLRQSVPAHNFTINDVALSPSGDHFVTASRDKTLKVWDAYTFELLKVIDFARHEGHKHSVNKIVWIKADNSVISCSDDRRVIRWQLGFS